MIEAILLCGLVWGFLLYSIRRGRRGERHVDRYTLLTWTVFVSIALVFIFRIPAVQPVIDVYFNDRPVTFVLSLLTVLVAVATYSITLKWVVGRSPHIYPLRRSHLWLIDAAPAVILSILLLMGVYLDGRLSSFRVQYLMKWLVEGYGLLQSTLVFVPINTQMFRQERVFPMRIKHLATLALTATFAVSTAFSVVFIPLILLTGHENPGPYLIPRGPIAALCLVIILVPHRWLVLLLLPRRLRRYARLAALERRLAGLVALRRERLAWWRLFRPEYVEMAIYVTLINILDNFRRADRADPRGCELYAQIQALLPLYADYDDLVEAICRVTI